MPSNLNLFDQPTRFIGRETELAEISQLLQTADCRLLTLVGVGGIGKTRLAVQLAKTLQETFVDGVWFINLQPVRSGQQIISVLMDTVGFVPSLHGTPENQLLQYLQEKKMLLLLDNFENVMDGVELLPKILQRAPEIKLLVTSREALSLPEEKLYPLEGLPTPLSYQTSEVETNTAVELFVERARQVRPDFSLPDNRASVVRICQLVEGLPLAIEIAASWNKTLRSSEIAAEIQYNLNFLTSNLRHVPERHRSMQAVFTQTWERLTETEQAIFKKLAVFRGGFHRAAAEHIAGASLALLSSLLDKCLLRREATGRYQIHELLRQYANAQLQLQESEALAEAHSRYYCGFLAQHKLGLVQQTQVETSAEIEEDLENIRSAWRYAVDHQLLDALKQAAAAYFYFCQIQSRYLESAEASGRAVEAFEAGGELEGLAQVLVFQAWMLIRVGEFEQALKALERSRALFEELHLEPVYGMGSHPLSALIILKVIQGDFAEAAAHGEELKAASALRADPHNLSFACYGLTSAYLNLGNYEAALANAEQAVKVCEYIGSRWFGAYCLIELGNVQRALGHYAEAERCYQESLRLRQGFKNPEGIAITAAQLGEIYLDKHNNQAAKQLFEQSLAIFQDLDDKGGVASAHHGLAQAACLAGETSLAVHHYREALKIASKIHFVPLLLSLLVDIGALMLTQNQKDRGVELLSLAQNHPASNQLQQEKAASLLGGISNRKSVPALDFDLVVSALETELLDFLPGGSPDQGPALIEPLTDRELAVLNLIAQGLSNPEIAEKLYISTGTVKAHSNRIYGKLGVENRVEAVIKAQELSLLTPKAGAEAFPIK